MGEPCGSVRLEGLRGDGDVDHGEESVGFHGDLIGGHWEGHITFPHRIRLLCGRQIQLHVRQNSVLGTPWPQARMGQTADFFCDLWPADSVGTCRAAVV